MRRMLVVVALAVGALVVVPTGSSAQAPSQDSAVGSGATPSSYQALEFTATSNPTGGSPSGSASWEQFGTFHFEGTVSCLAVTDNRAVIGIDIDTSASTVAFEGFFLTVVDGGPEGSGLDTFDAVPTDIAGIGDVVPTDCSVAPQAFAVDTLTTGDIVVTDAPPFPTSKDQCKDGGWRNFGSTFKNQGQCVSFVATGGKKQP